MDSAATAADFIRRGFLPYEDGVPWVGIWQDGALVGGALFFPVDWRVRSSEISYWLGAAAAGRGLMTRTVTALLDFVFGSVGLNRVALQAETTNAPSRACAERLGFALEGIRRQSFASDDRLVDMAAYSMLAADWHALRGAPAS